MFHFDEPAIWVPWVVVLMATSAGAVTDIRERRIPNLLTIPTFLVGLGYSLTPYSRVGILEALAATCLLATPYILLYRFAGGGAGDAKLMGALGAWLGLESGLFLLFCVCGTGLLQAVWRSYKVGHLSILWERLTYLLRGVALKATGRDKTLSLSEYMPKIEGTPTIPYGVAILTGSMVSGTLTLLNS